MSVAIGPRRKARNSRRVSQPETRKYIIIVRMRIYRSVLLLCCAVLALAQAQTTVEQVADFIRSELALGQHSDKQIAVSVRKLRLTEKLTNKTIADLQAQGAGPKTVQALESLRDSTANMKPPAQDATYSPATAHEEAPLVVPPAARPSSKVPSLPPPDSSHQQKMLDRMKEYALNYTHNLPNFMCVESIKRAVDPNAGDNYRSVGTVLARVSYNEGQENYKVYSVNGKLTNNTSMDSVGDGATSTGEFASLMREIFEPKSEATFGWEKWTTLRGRPMAVFNYSIDRAHSRWSVSYGPAEHPEQSIITAYKGSVYADPATGEISRIKFQAVGIPTSFPVKDTTELLDYDLVDISGQKYVVPMMAQLFIRAGRDSARNEIEFRLYRKYDANSAITYDADPNDLPPLPASKTQEQPR
jgi:hypothetical protein